MTSEEFDGAIALEKVRQLKTQIEGLDMYVGPIITDTDHARFRAMARIWEQRIQATLKIRKMRSADVQPDLIQN